MTALAPFQGLSFFVCLEPRLDESTEQLQKLIVLCGGKLSEDVPSADYCVLQHCKQPEHEQATAAHRRCVGVCWVLASLRLGRPAPLGSCRFRPFPAAALLSPSALRMSITGFTAKERFLVLVLARCTGAEVTGFLRIDSSADRMMLIALDVDERSQKTLAARSHPYNVDLLNSLWLLDCLMEGRLMPRDGYRGPGCMIEALCREADAAQPVAAGEGQEAAAAAAAAAPAAAAGSCLEVAGDDEDGEGGVGAGTGAQGAGAAAPGGSAAASNGGLDPHGFVPGTESACSASGSGADEAGGSGRAPHAVQGRGPARQGMHRRPFKWQWAPLGQG